MKIKTKSMTYEEVLKLPHAAVKPPRRPSGLLRGLIYMLASGELKKTDFKCSIGDMKGFDDKKPALYLMNHSCFTDLMIASHVIKGPYNIVCTSDGFVGKDGLMRSIGCIPTEKFHPDIRLIKDISYSLNNLHCSVLMYPEASYSFDGTATPLPLSLGKFIKILGHPVIMIRTHGAFIHDPLYNGLRVRNNRITAEEYALFTPDELRDLSADDINLRLREAFTFDNFREQYETHTPITETFRAEGLSRVLYKCPVCGAEGSMKAHDTKLECTACGADWELGEYGSMIPGSSVSGKDPVSKVLFDHIPDWYAWERECVREELLSGTYSLKIPVTIRVMTDHKAIYEIGKGTLTHTADGFHLTGESGAPDIIQKPLASYSLYSDYFWYEIGDMICIGDGERLFYCFPEEGTDVVAKTRLAAEELYKLTKNKAI